MRTWEGQQHGRIKHQKISFTKDQFTRDSGEKNTVLKKLNSIDTVQDGNLRYIVHPQQVVQDFTNSLFDSSADPQEVSGNSLDRGFGEQPYVQIVLKIG